MTDVFDITWLLPFFMYAETHYRFRYFWSYLKKNEPEIVADAPHRIEPGNDIPLLILVKDGHRYPCTLMQITVTGTREGTMFYQKKLLKKPIAVRNDWWWQVHQIPRNGIKGWIILDVRFDIECRGEHRAYHNDNYRTSSKTPLKVFVSESPLPKLPGLHFGDAHVHSSYTNDQVEYGAPLRPSATLSSAIGLSFFCVTDHSYDLDDDVSNYLCNDPSLPKWKALQKEISDINRSTQKHKIVLGEEVSCRNSGGKNVHFLLFGNREYVPGSGDSAERWLHTTSELSIPEVLTRHPGGNAAAHPKEHMPFIQKLLLGRGSWLRDDLQNAGVAGIQFLNGQLGSGFQRGKREWIRLLLSGRHSFALAGSDAHGNFNRFRQIGLPFVSIAEHDRHIFGRMRTGLLLDSALSVGSILLALQEGSSVISDGPVGTFTATNERGTTASLGGLISGTALELHVIAASSDEFGLIQSIKVYCGFFGKAREETVYAKSEIGNLRFDESFRLKIRQNGYLRLEVTTTAANTYDSLPHFCISNPIWFDNSGGPNKKPFRRRA